MNLTPQQRLEAYKYAKDEIRISDHFACICAALDCAIIILLRVPPYIGWEVGLTFPELYDQKPADKLVNGFWWSLNEDGKLSRLHALDQCIAKTEALILTANETDIPENDA